MPENPSRVTDVRQSPRSVRHNSVTETVLYSFGAYGSGDGYDPSSGLTYFKGTFYGTTSGGGVRCGHFAGCGTVYSITPSGTETVLHSFTGAEDGADPRARLIVLKGTLYGTTSVRGGGKCRGGCGTVFSITPSGHETVLHEFTGSPDGSTPWAALRDLNGTLYGTTANGGAYGNGTVFSITPSGHEHVIYSFQGLGGALPSFGRLVALNGKLYGSTAHGGKYGEGAVFSLSTSGREKLLHSFNGLTGSSKDGAYPYGGLTAIKQTLYGTTQNGGDIGCNAYEQGCGIVFSITPTGTETVLHSFTGSDGSAPEATLLSVNGTLYGTTLFGGAYNYGTVFSITRSGHETVLYSFKGGQDGSDPWSGLSYVNGTFYGTTASGGAYKSGTVFSIKL
jgi:uncharacterized repeat protein (TIGR03803 family)